MLPSLPTFGAGVTTYIKLVLDPPLNSSKDNRMHSPPERSTDPKWVVVLIEVQCFSKLKLPFFTVQIACFFLLKRTTPSQV